MKNPTKAALLSAFIFPGAGHYFLKKYIQTVILVSITSSAVYYLISKSVEKALQIVEKIENGEVPPDVATITELLSKQSMGADAQSLDTATLIIGVCWAIGIVDSYRIAYLKDKGNL